MDMRISLITLIWWGWISLFLPQVISDNFTPSPIPLLASHALTHSSHLNQYILTGGILVTSPTESISSLTYLVPSVSPNTITSVTAIGTGTITARRAYHGAVSIGNGKLILVFGVMAFNPIQFPYPPLVSIDESTGTVGDQWSMTPPPGRYGHVTGFDSLHNRIWVYGGIRQDTSAVTNDLLYFDIGKSTWTVMTPSLNSSASSSSSSSAILPSFGSSSILIQHYFIICFGTVTSSQTPSSWCNVVDTTSGDFISPTILGTIPSPRSGASLTLIPGTSKAILFGGGDTTTSTYLNDIYILDFSGLPESMTFSLMTTSGPIPAPRMNHVAVMAEDQVTLIIWGGRGDSASTALLSQIHTLDTSSLKWIISSDGAGNPGTGVSGGTGSDGNNPLSNGKSTVQYGAVILGGIGFVALMIVFIGMASRVVKRKGGVKKVTSTLKRLSLKRIGVGQSHTHNNDNNSNNHGHNNNNNSDDENDDVQGSRDYLSANNRNGNDYESNHHKYHHRASGKWSLSSKSFSGVGGGISGLGGGKPVSDLERCSSVSSFQPLRTATTPFRNCDDDNDEEDDIDDKSSNMNDSLNRSSSTGPILSSSIRGIYTQNSNSINGSTVSYTANSNSHSDSHSKNTISDIPPFLGGSLASKNAVEMSSIYFDGFSGVWNGCDNTIGHENDENGKNLRTFDSSDMDDPTLEQQLPLPLFLSHFPSNSNMNPSSSISQSNLSITSSSSTLSPSSNSTQNPMLSTSFPLTQITSSTPAVCCPPPTSSITIPSQAVLTRRGSATLSLAPSIAASTRTESTVADIQWVGFDCEPRGFPPVTSPITPNSIINPFETLPYEHHYPISHTYSTTTTNNPISTNDVRSTTPSIPSSTLSSSSNVKMSSERNGHTPVLTQGRSNNRFDPTAAPSRSKFRSSIGFLRNSGNHYPNVWKRNSERIKSWSRPLSRYTSTTSSSSHPGPSSSSSSPSSPSNSLPTTAATSTNALESSTLPPLPLPPLQSLQSLSSSTTFSPLTTTTQQKQQQEEGLASNSDSMTLPPLSFIAGSSLLSSSFFSPNEIFLSNNDSTLSFSERGRESEELLDTVSSDLTSSHPITSPYSSKRLRNRTRSTSSLSFGHSHSRHSSGSLFSRFFNFDSTFSNPNPNNDGDDISNMERQEFRNQNNNDNIKNDHQEKRQNHQRQLSQGRRIGIGGLVGSISHRFHSSTSSSSSPVPPVSRRHTITSMKSISDISNHGGDTQDKTQNSSYYYNDDHHDDRILSHDLAFTSQVTNDYRRYSSVDIGIGTTHHEYDDGDDENKKMKNSYSDRVDEMRDLDEWKRWVVTSKKRGSLRIMNE